MASEVVTITLNGFDEYQVALRELSKRLCAVGSIAEIERRVGRKVDEDLIRDLFVIEQIGTELWLEPTPEMDRVLRALDG